MNKIIVAGIPITVVRKRMKNMYMRIKADGSVTISAPSRASDQAVQAFAASQESWLEKHMKALAEKPVKAFQLLKDVVCSASGQKVFKVTCAHAGLSYVRGRNRQGLARRSKWCRGYSWCRRWSKRRPS